MNLPRLKKWPSVDVVLGVYNKPHLAAACVESLEEHTSYPSWRLLLLDDAGDEFTRRMLAGYAARSPRIRLLRNPQNLGFIGTYNRGMQLSEADYVVLLNSDTVMSPDWLGKLVAIAESDPTIGMVNPMSNEFANLSVPLAPGASFLTMNEALRRRNPGEAFDVVTAVGFCLLIRRKALEQLGYLDEIFGRGYCEDSDLHMRFTAAGWRAVAAADTYVYHLSHGTFSTATAEERYQHNIKIFRARWGDRYDRDFREFLAGKRLETIRRQFESGPEAEPAMFREPSWKRGARFVLRHGRKLPQALRRPRHAAAVLREKLRTRFRPAEAAPAPAVPAETPIVQTAPRAYTTHPGAPSVTFVLEAMGFFGGCRRVVELANQLILLGVDARVAVAHRENVARELLQDAYFGPMFFNGYEDLSHNLPVSDVLVSTFWLTAPHVREAAAGRAAVAVNFLQDYDPWFYTDEQLKERSLASYPMIDHRVVTSHWLQGLLEERGFSSTVIPLGFNAKEFYPSATREARLARAGERAAAPLRVVAMARPHTPYRGFDDLLAAMRAVHARRPAVEIALFGCDQLSDHGEIDFPVVNLGTIRDRVELCRRYNESDVFVDASHFQGFGLPALEAMSCGVACVLTNVGGVNQYARDGRNALMVPPHSPPRLADAVVRLLDEEPLRRRVADEGRRTVEGMSPAAEAIAWRDYLAKVCPQFRRKWIPARRRLAA